MIKLKINEKIRSYCIQLLRNHNFGNRGVADGTPEQQLIGLIGQCEVLIAFDLPLIKGSTGFDGGKDFEYYGRIVDVKTMGRTTEVKPYYVNNFIGLQKDYQTDIYIFCSLNTRTDILTICGWLDKGSFFRRATFHPKGSVRTRSDGSFFITFADLYEVKNQDLYDADTIKELKDNIENFIVLDNSKKGDEK